MKNYEDEDARTARVVDEAAREVEPEGLDEPFEPEEAEHRPLPRPTLHPDGPDLKVYISTDAKQGRYAYQMIDTTTGLSHNCVRVVPDAGHTGLALLCVFNALRSITRNRCNELITERYGFSSRSAAVASLTRVKVQIVVTDPDLAQLGAILCDPVNTDALNFIRLGNSDDRLMWRIILNQTNRFDIEWTTLAADAPVLQKLKGWADMVLGRASHSGPVWSPTQRHQSPDPRP